MEVGRAYRNNEGLISKGDVVLYINPDDGSTVSIGEVYLLLVQDNAKTLSILSQYEITGFKHHACTFRVQERPQLVAAEALRCSVIYSRSGSTGVALLPLAYRPSAS